MCLPLPPPPPCPALTPSNHEPGAVRIFPELLDEQVVVGRQDERRRDEVLQTKVCS